MHAAEAVGVYGDHGPSSEEETDIEAVKLSHTQPCATLAQGGKYVEQWR